MTSLKKNVVWSSILTTANYIFPLITYPYVSRVLGVTNIGICNFVDSIINYYIIFSMMGISYIGIREVATNKEDKIKLSKTFSSLILLNLITTFVMVFALIISIYTVPKFHVHANLLFIGVFKLIFNSILVEWLYQGIEDFRYITLRSVLVRFCYVAAVFIFVRDANDFLWYYLIQCLTIVINSIINIFHSRLFVSFSFKGINFNPFIKAFFILGIYQFLTSLYKSFNIVYLGFIGGETQVGYYTTATKLHSIILALFAAYTSVMMPRMSSLVSDGKIDEFNKLFSKSISILFSFAVPIICVFIVFADQLVRWVSGEGYELATPSMRIVMPIVFFIGYEQILVYQILVPLKKDRTIFFNSIIGASVGFVMNLILVPILYSIGSAIVWLVSEFVVLAMSQYFVKKYLGLGFPFKLLFRYLLVSIPIFTLLIGFHIWNPFFNFTLFVAFFVTIVYFAFVEWFIFKNDIFIDITRQFVKRINHKI